jgi:predicted Zn-dependent peptidase
VLSVDEVLARIEGITRADVLAVARELAQAPRTLSAVGPFDEQDFESHQAALAAQ